MSRNKRNRNSSRRPLLLILVGVLFIVGAGLIWRFWPIQAPPQTAPVNPAANVDEVERISVTDALIAHQQGQAVFLDVRSLQDYQTSHIAGAVSIPLDEIGTRYPELNDQDWIITYCT